MRQNVGARKNITAASGASADNVGYEVELWQLVDALSGTLHVRTKCVAAERLETAEEFVVRAEGAVAKHQAPSCSAYVKELRAALLENGVLKVTSDGYTFTQGYVFASPLTAAGVVLRSCVERSPRLEDEGRQVAQANSRSRGNTVSDAWERIVMQGSVIWREGASDFAGPTTPQVAA